MPNYKVDYTYAIREGAAMVMNANNTEDAAERVIEEVRDMDPMLDDIQIESIEEIVD